ncbi:MAG: hypothetical protein Q8M98_05220 [Candidatus Cloacimonadaceae bacterium]|nr:hypothetical protein [Candidatus Cloacimonadaceae bacterium]
MPMKEGLKPTGLLSPKSTDKFLDLVILNTPILQAVTPAKVSEAVATYPTVAAALYKTRGFTTAHSGAGRQGVATLTNLTGTDVSYSLKELVLALVIQDSYVEDMDTDPEKIAELIAKVYAKDLQYLIINGDVTETGTTDQLTVRKILNGIVKQLTDNSLTCPWAAGDTTIIKKLGKLVAGAPDDVIANPNTKIFLAPTDYTLLWDDVMTNNKTVAIRDGRVWFRGLEIIDQPLLPANRPIVGDMTNFLVPMGREIMIEAQRYPEARGFKCVLSSRIDVNQYPNANLRILAATAT